MLSFLCQNKDGDALDQDLYFVQQQLAFLRLDVGNSIVELLGEISSSSESEGDDDSDKQLENYLINPLHSDSQEMARTKQTARKLEKPTEPKVSAGGIPLVLKSPRRSSRIAGHDSDSLLDVATNYFGMLAPRRSPRKRGANATGFTSDEGETSGASSRSKRSRRGEGPKVVDSEVQGDDPGEVPKTGGSGLGTGAGTKSVRIQRKQKVSMKQLCTQWNQDARTNHNTETARGWLKKTSELRKEQGRALTNAQPGMRALKEIRHYQRCQVFLMAVIPFQRLVREIMEDLRGDKPSFHWQSNALFTLQVSTESYMAGFYNDVNLCALHRKVITINRKDVWLAIQIRGREHVGGRGQVSDVGAVNVSAYRIADPREQGKRKMDYAEDTDWLADLRAKVQPKGVETIAVLEKPGKGGGKGIQKGTVRRRRVLRDCIRGISKATFLRFARRGGVKRFSGNIYEESRGVLKVFLEEVMKDIMVFVEHFKRKTVTPIDVIFALKRHNRMVYTLDRPFPYSRKKPTEGRTAQRR